MIKNKTQFHRFLPLFLTLLLLLISGGAIFGSPSAIFTSSAAAADHILNYSVDRSQLPQMNYYNLTYNIYVGEATTVTVKNGSNQTLPSSYNTGTNILSLTTDETAFSITLNDFTGSTDNVGEIKVAPLKDNNLWAWSHGFDDNQQFLKAIYFFEQNNIPATLYLNDYESGSGNIIVDNGKTNPANPTTACDLNNSTTDLNTECFFILRSKIIQLFEDGWAIGNHTEDHTCWSSDNSDKPADSILWTDITNLDAKYQSKIISGSTRSNYLINSFAAPCFNDYNDLIQAKIAGNETEIIMSEGGERDYTSPDGFSGAANELPLRLGYDFTSEVIRDPRIEGTMTDDGDDAASLTFIQRMFDWLHNNASVDGPVTYWYNSISHGRNDVVFASAIPYLINNYGSEVWIATAEEIYAYTYMREKAVISLECSSTVGNCAQNPVIMPEIIPGDNQIYGRVFNDVNQNGLDDNEPGIANISINYWIDTDCDGNFNFATDYGSATLSEADGSYLFDGLNSSHCYFTQIDGATTTGYSLTSTNTGNDDNIDNDFFNNLYTEKISLPVSFVSAGFIQDGQLSTATPTSTVIPGSDQITGRIFNDANFNGVDDDEAGIAGIRLVHWVDSDCDAQINFGTDYGGDTTTGSDGSYQFTNLNPSLCYFVQIDPATVNGLAPTTTNIGDDSKDNDFHANFYTDQLMLPVPNVNGGLYDPSSVTSTPTSIPSSTETPAPTPTIIPTPTQLPTGISQTQIFKGGEFGPNFITDYTWGTQTQILNNQLRVSYQDDHGALFVRQWGASTPNVVALNFDVRNASFASKVLFTWVVWDGNDHKILDEHKLLLDICPGNYVITQNVPENVGGFALQEYSGERITVEHHSFDLDNVSFLVEDNPPSGNTIAQSVPDCPINTIHLPIIVR